MERALISLAAIREIAPPISRKKTPGYAPGLEYAPIGTGESARGARTQLPIGMTQ
jgi:hypothetical protein